MLKVGFAANLPDDALVGELTVHPFEPAKAFDFIIAQWNQAFPATVGATGAGELFPGDHS